MQCIVQVNKPSEDPYQSYSDSSDPGHTLTTVYAVSLGNAYLPFTL